MPDWPNLIATLREQGLDAAEAAAPRAVGGGDIDAAWRLDTADGPVFVKTCGAADFERLAAEAAGLEALAETATLRVPRVLACVESGRDAALALEWMTFERADSHIETMLGTGLAAMHRNTAKHFGWHRDNTIGATPQINTPDDDWIRFFRVHRLEHQLALASANGFGGELQREGARLAAGLGKLFEGYAPPASLLHGDLWGGNWAAAGGEPVIYDPAVYYGDRETDLAMTRLFGGFGDAFYRAYDAAWPLAPGHRGRALLYQLYHVLNHLNLFGRGYLGRALALVRAAQSASNSPDSSTM